MSIFLDWHYATSYFHVCYSWDASQAGDFDTEKVSGLNEECEHGRREDG
jgi:hypothetical protein